MSKKSDQISSSFMGLFGLLTSYGAVGLGYGRIRNPGPGFFPFWAGMFLLLISGFLFAKSTFSAQQDTDEKPWAGIRWKMVGAIVASLFLYTILFDLLGFVISTFCLMLSLFKLEKSQRWRTSILMSIVTVAVAYLVFSVWLNLYFPAGIFGA